MLTDTVLDGVKVRVPACAGCGEPLGFYIVTTAGRLGECCYLSGRAHAMLWPDCPHAWHDCTDHPPPHRPRPAPSLWPDMAPRPRRLARPAYRPGSRPELTIEQVLARLDRVERRDEQRWQARCPAHDDKTPSLSIAVGDRRPVLLYCHAGCSYEDITNAIGAAQ